ncbi:hypothetical protein [Algibacter mikhailovii]|uniref:hypothetical protein n=1 Tax=Algibacter mikhailovii TaxID=425498 RepID=UPI00249492F5|nr:hypothetical protein [Algibacter mikhailovii]
MMRNYMRFLVFVLSLHSFSIGAQSSTYIDDSGVMRWSINDKELCVFGTNYAVPFAYWDLRAPLIGDNHKKAIDEDVYHMARLGLDGFRIHVMEAFISDEYGNLIENQHLDLFDYLLYKLKQRGIKMYITPMYLNTSIDGSFANKYGFNIGCLSDRKAFPAQENYLMQFVSHVNPYTGTSYKDDVDIIAFEIVNEPRHWEKPELIIDYANTMYDAVKSIGCDKPLLYNMTTCVDFIDDVLKTKVNGGSFQWYPTGLTSNHVQKGNFLPNVDKYLVPFDDKLKASKRPKFVYEFSPSDTNGAYMYPAMARSFREAGFQFAAHFSYDPLHAAHTNIEYKTHFLNLAYTPKKAIGMMIASEAFHQIGLYESFGRFPENNTFKDFRLSYEDDLAILNSEEKLYYSTSNAVNPKNIEALKHVAGTGNSQIIKYEGTGAYFLDRLENGVWRFEVMPDAFWVKDPFFVPYTDGESAVVLSKNHDVKIMLPDLGNAFSIEGINKENVLKVVAQDNSFMIHPGVYILKAKDVDFNLKNTRKIGNIQLNEFHIPNRKIKQDYLLHDPVFNVSKGEPITLSAKIISEEQPENVEVIVLSRGKGETFSMRKIDTYSYAVTLPDKYTNAPQVIRYHISYRLGNTYRSFPSGKNEPYLLSRTIYSDDTSLDDSESYQIKVIDNQYPIVLFDASSDWEAITHMDRKSSVKLIPSKIPNKTNIILSFPERNKHGKDVAFRYFCKNNMLSRAKDLDLKTKIVVHGKSHFQETLDVKIQLILKDGSAYSGTLGIDQKMDDYAISLHDFKPDEYILLPRPYPKFQAKYFETTSQEVFKLSDVEAIQIVFSEVGNMGEKRKNPSLELGWITME